MQITPDIALKPYNTFGIQHTAKYFSILHSEADIQPLLEFQKEKNTGLLILGGGSNILFTKDFDGLIIKNSIPGITVEAENDQHVFIRVGAGENWHQFVLYCLRHNYGGIENLSLIPGNTGASPMQNIGAYGVEIKDVFHCLTAYHIQEKILVTFNSNECEFGYRESVFKKKQRGIFIITSVTFKLTRKPILNISYGAIQQELDAMKISKLTIQAVAQAVINIRTSKLPDPKIIGNAGSFFKNPEIPDKHFKELQLTFPGIVGYPLENGNVKIAAGWLIEQCGWKGFRKGDAGCHEKQALVLVNFGNAEGSEIFDLSSEILSSVFQKFGIMLERGVNII